MADTPSGDSGVSGGPNPRKGKSLADYAKQMGVEVDALKKALRKYGLEESELSNQQKRSLLSSAMSGGWSKDEWKGQYDRNIADSADWDWETIIEKFGYSLGLLKQYEADLRPIFKWVAAQLQKGESFENLQEEFNRRINRTAFGRRPSSEIIADKERYGAGRRDFRKVWDELTARVRRYAVGKYGEAFRTGLDEGVARQIALDLIYGKDGFLVGTGMDDDIDLALRPIYRQWQAEPVPGDVVDDGTDETESTGNTDYSGSAGAFRSQLMAWLSRNGVVMVNDRVEDYITRMIDGQITLDAVKQEIRDTVFTRQYGAYADLFAAGQDVADIAMDYRQTAAQLLERTVDDIDINDPLIRKAMQGTSADGKPAAMSLYDFEREVRSSDEWQKTDNAMTVYTGIGEDLLRTFGFRG